jgi:diguanylate cyclase (GGDEF)-like protein
MSNDHDSDGMAEQALNRFSQHTGNKPVVLIADDSRVVRVSLRNILKESCQLIEVEDGEQAWSQLCNTPSVDLIFSDLSMPKLDGRNLLTKIRASQTEQIAKIPFIVVTGNEASEAIISELESLGASGMLHKPFDPQLIKQFVAELAHEPQQSASIDEHDSDLQTDFLDNTTNRSQFMEIASRELSFAIRNKNELALALVKIDQFSNISKHYSEAAIEHILLALKDIIQLHIHPDDTLAYIGEGCFSILRPASNAIGTRYLGRRILEDLTAKQFYLGESDKSVTASIGISAPDIKPGTRLQDLLILAEGRLNAAIENGGDKVIDKGNENLTPVFMQENSELSNVISTTQTNTSQAQSNNSSEINRLSIEQAAEIKAKHTAQLRDAEAQTTQISEYKRALEDLTDENRSLIEDVKRWKKESSEAEHLRRQLFEVESQFQQLKIKYAEAQKTNEELALRSETVARENRCLVDGEEERTATLRHSYQVIEDENRHLESQISELRVRTEKAELESLKSNQLVCSLRENGNLLRMQLDQLQQQNNELQKQQYQDNKPTTPPETSTSESSDSEIKSDTDLLDELYQPELALTATPKIEKPETNKNESVHMFPDKDQVSSRRKTFKKPKIPPFRIEAEPTLFKNGLNLSPFTIASIIFLILLSTGSLYLYFTLNSDPVQVTSAESQMKRQYKPTPSQPPPQATATVANQKLVPVKSTQQQAIVKKKDFLETTTVIDASIREELRLEKELTLRQMAEDEFNRNLDRATVSDTQLANQGSNREQIQEPTHPPDTENQALPNQDKALNTPPNSRPEAPSSKSN